MKLLKLTAAFCFAFMSTEAQTVQSKQNRFQIELDPLGYIFNGYSVHAIDQTAKFSYDLGTWALDIPKGFTDNQGFDERTWGYGGKINYHFTGYKGWYAGVGFDYSSQRATYKLTSNSSTGHSIGTGLQCGYRIFFRREPKGFYINPWIGISYNFFTNKIEFVNIDYKQSRLTFFPTVHLGYRF